MKAVWRRSISRFGVPLALVLGICSGVQKANAAGFLWISAQNWSYSAAEADSPAGAAYFWGLSAGAGSFSWAYAFSFDGAGDAAYAFAQASAGALGGLGGADVAGIADPYAGIGIDISLTDPSNPDGFPQSQPGSDPFTSGYTVSGTGITGLNESSSELGGVDELEAFTYGGGTDIAALEAELGVSSANGSTSSGDVVSIDSLIGDFGLIPLDPLIKDPTGLSELDFTENDSNVDPNNVILVGIGEVSTPEPAAVCLFGAGLLGLWLLRRKAA